jgi:hypothetical protein
VLSRENLLLINIYVLFCLQDYIIYFVNCNVLSRESLLLINVYVLYLLYVSTIAPIFMFWRMILENYERTNKCSIFCYFQTPQWSCG